MSFNTDYPDVAPANRNNCRAGDDKNCMYYNSSQEGQSYYNWSAVQGTGAPGEADYRCMNKAFDKFNAAKVYVDGAVGDLGTYAETEGNANDAGTVNYDNERQYGKRDSCEGKHDHSPGDGHNHHHIRNSVDLVKHEVSKHRQIALFAAVAVIIFAWKTGRLDLSKRSTQLLLAAAAVAVLFFF